MVVVGDLHQPGQVREPPGIIVYLFAFYGDVLHFAKVSGNVRRKVPLPVFSCLASISLKSALTFSRSAGAPVNTTMLLHKFAID